MELAIVMEQEEYEAALARPTFSSKVGGEDLVFYLDVDAMTAHYFHNVRKYREIYGYPCEKDGQASFTHMSPG